jgi:molybdopterin converting factor small subunit
LPALQRLIDREIRNMGVQIDIPLFLQHFTNGVRVANVSGNTVGDCLFDLVRQFPQLRELLLDKDGRLHKYVEIFVNGKSTYPGELAKSVKDGDEIHILNIIAGG